MHVMGPHSKELKVLLATLLAVSSCLASDNRVGIFVDRSASVRNLYLNGAMRNIVGAMEKSIPTDGKKELWAFSNTSVQVPDFAAIDAMPFGDQTRLELVGDVVLNRGLRFAWIVTDNVQSGPEGDGDTRRFYSQLQRSEVDRIYVFPLLQVPQTPGLVAYLISLKGVPEEDYIEVSNAFKRHSSTFNANPLQMKPLDADTVRPVITDRRGDKRFREGEPLRVEYEIKFSSYFKHLVIRDGQIGIPAAKPEFGLGPGSLLTPERRDAVISPTSIHVNPGEQTSQSYLLKVDLGRVRLRRDLRSLWRAAFDRSQELARIPVELKIKVLPSDFQISPEYLKQYDSPTPLEAQAQGRIYGLRSLPSAMATKNIEITVPVQLEFTVDYPAYPAILFVLVGAVLLVLMLLLVAPIRRKCVSLWNRFRGSKAAGASSPPTSAPSTKRR